MKIVHIGRDPADASVLVILCEVERPVVIQPDLNVVARDAQGEPLWGRRFRDQSDSTWLPRGRYAFSCWGGSALTQAARIDFELRRRGPATADGDDKTTLCDRQSIAPDALETSPVSFEGRNDAVMMLRAIDGTPDPASLSWARDHSDWFHRHFDHAAPTIVHYLLKDSDLLQGRILDVGCGDGITDLAIALHCEPELMIGIDPFRGYERLPEILAANHVPADAIPDCLRYAGEDGNHLPFPDDSFDVVLSWGSLEHIAGGYHQALREIKRVLRNGGLFFVHPGLYYSNYGHHLGEFSNEPFFHLKKSEEELRELVLSTPPRYIDRAGEFSNPKQYWQWYKELNPITVDSFEKELRAFDFELWRVAIRTEDVIEYTPEILSYPMQDLATVELYVACRNRKLERPESYRVNPPEDWFKPDR